VIGVPPRVLDDHIPHLVGVRKQRERLEIVEQEQLPIRPFLERSDDVTVAAEDARRLGMSHRVGIEAARHNRVKHAEEIVLVG
jgi:hypothetical protein